MQSSTINSKRVKYFLEDSPNHISGPGIYLKQLRERQDHSSCDMELLLQDGSLERLHTIIVASHSGKLAEIISASQQPCRLDMTAFSPKCVRKLVDWMYKGEVQLSPLSDLMDDLIVSHHLGVVVLHRQLEQILCRLAKDDEHFLLALKTATNKATGISDDTIRQCLNAVCDRNEISNSESLQKLNVDTIRALVSSDCSQDKKMRLVNTALNWLRLPDNMVYCDAVIAEISVKELHPTELDHLKKKLAETMGNEDTRGLAGIKETVVERLDNFKGTDDGLSNAIDDVILESQKELGGAALGRLRESINKLVAKLTSLDANRSVSIVINNDHSCHTTFGSVAGVASSGRDARFYIGTMANYYNGNQVTHRPLPTMDPHLR